MKRILIAVLLLLALVVPVGAQSVSRFGAIVAQKITATNGLTVTSGGATVTAGGLTVSAGATALGAKLNLAPQTALVVTSGGTITPVGAYQQITAAGAVGTSAITAGNAGDVLILINTGSNTITLTDTGTLKLGGNAALGPSDALALFSDGTNWIQASKADN